MRRICAKLKSDGVRMDRFDALDFFAREGDWQTIVYAGEVATLEAWEIDPAHEPGLRRNLPGATIRIVDSYEEAARCSNRFDFVVLDNPQATFGPDGKYCEHFEALMAVLRLLRPGAFLIFNVNWAPYGFEQHPEWQRRRQAFYGLADTSNLSVEEFLLPFYSRLLESRGFRVTRRFAEPRNNDYLAYAVFQMSGL